MSALVSASRSGAGHGCVAVLDDLLLLAFQLTTTGNHDVFERLIFFVHFHFCYPFEGRLSRNKLTKHCVL